MDFANAYAKIIKADENADGTMTVYGKATDDSVDLDQQICDEAWLKTAMPVWFQSGGNIREQHSNIAAGVAQEYEAKSDGHYISALVVDPVSVKKVKTGVLKGFSIGIKSPRVIRDNKAAGGRIVDGQIIEISLVDRPANPNAKLIMAKSVEGEATLVQVEELHEYKAPLPSALAKSVAKTEKGSKMETIKQITELAKSLTSDTVKFDQAAFETARRAVAQLIVAEANEVAEGSDETYSLNQLVEVANHLIAWYEGEVQEGEAAPMSNIELAVEPEVQKDPDSTAGCDCAGCKSCKGCDSKMCSGHTDAMKDAEKSADISKCLECGCHNVTDSHGASTVVVPAAGGHEVANVSTAATLNTEGSIKSADADVVPAEEKAEEVAEVATDEVSEAEPVEVLAEEKSLLSDDVVNTIIEKAVSMATESVKAEVELVKSALEAAESKSASLETELAQAKSLAMGGAPKRSAIAAGKTNNNDLLVKAAAYSAKAASATDSVLAKGYREMANELIAEANKSE